MTTDVGYYNVFRDVAVRHGWEVSEGRGYFFAAKPFVGVIKAIPHLDSQWTGQTMLVTFSAEPARSGAIEEWQLPRWRIPVELLELSTEAACLYVTGNETLLFELFESLKDYPSVNVRQVLAACVATPPELLNYLAFDPDRKVREAVARNPFASSRTRTLSQLPTVNS